MCLKLFLSQSTNSTYLSSQPTVTCKCTGPSCNDGTCTPEYNDIITGHLSDFACKVWHDYNPEEERFMEYQGCVNHVVDYEICLHAPDGVEVNPEGDVTVCCYEDYCNTFEFLHEVMATVLPSDGKFLLLPYDGERLLQITKLNPQLLSLFTDAYVFCKHRIITVYSQLGLNHENIVYE